MAYSYWQRPGVVRLTKVYVFNMTNQDGFLNNGEKPRLEEVGPFIYRYAFVTPCKYTNLKTNQSPELFCRFCFECKNVTRVNFGGKMALIYEQGPPRGQGARAA